MKFFRFIILLPLILIPFNIRKSINAADNNTNFTNLIVFARFNDETEFIKDKYQETSVLELVDNMYNNSYYSVNNYFKFASNDKVKMRNLYLFANGGSIQINRSRGYYCEYSETNTIGYQNGAGASRFYDLKEDWARAINDTLNAEGYLYDAAMEKKYSYAELDKNNDLKIDAITILYKSAPDNLTTDWSSPLWNYQDSSSLVELSYNGKIITSDKYVQITCNYSDNVIYTDNLGYKIAQNSVIIHETAHMFGLKDLYRSDMSSRVYYMSAMAKHISPIPQFISAKEREALGWIESNQIREINKNGTYSLNAVGEEKNSLIAYKIKLNNGKTAYLEYRDFSKNSLNRFDNQYKTLIRANGTNLNGITAMKSGLVCYLVDSDTKFPNNLNTSGNKWNYEVLGGSYATKVDAALGLDDEIYLSADVALCISDIDDKSITFELSGDGLNNNEAVISGINIIDYKENMYQGEKYLCKAQIAGDNLTGNEQIEWSIEGNLTSETVIDNEGNLVIASNENSKNITLIARTENGIECRKTINIFHKLVKYSYHEAGCINDGNIEYWHCDICDSYFSDEMATNKITKEETIIKALGHKEEIIKGYPASCVASGLTDGKKCGVCNEILEEQKIIEKQNHNLTHYSYFEAGCINDGNIEYWHCDICDSYFSDEMATNKITKEAIIIKALGHKEEIIKGYPASCVASGLTNGKKCSVCNEILEEQKIIERLDHIESDWILDSKPSFNENGKMHKECINCHTVLISKEIQKLDKLDYIRPAFIIIFGVIIYNIIIESIKA